LLIATVAYGSKFDDEVTLLREFRGNHLLANYLESQFVNLFCDLIVNFLMNGVS